jgi:hypothetical protein
MKKEIKLTASQAFELQANKFSDVLNQLNKQTEVWIELKNGICKVMMALLFLQAILCGLILFK